MATSTENRGRPMSVERETALLDAAIEVLSEVGFEQLTVRMVCERAGASTKTAYRRWANKEELLVAALRRAVLREVDSDPLISWVGTLREDLIENLVRRPDTYRNSRNLVLGLIVASQVAGELGEVAKLLVRRREAWFAALLLRVARDRGEILRGPDPEFLADLVRSFFLHHILVLDDPPTRASIIAAVDGVFLPAIHHADAMARSGPEDPHLGYAAEGPARSQPKLD